MPYLCLYLYCVIYIKSEDPASFNNTSIEDMLKSGQQGGRPRKRRRHYEFAKKLTMQAVLNEIKTSYVSFSNMSNESIFWENYGVTQIHHKMVSMTYFAQIQAYFPVL